MLNEQGKSFAFDHRGSGYGRGEGCAAVILRRLDDAVRCNDPIRAVILGTGVNQDGKTPGITRPDSEAQASLAEAVLRKSGVHPREIGYIEAHGTGTMAGDIAEMQSIAKVYCHERMDSVYVGSIKSNIGHLESVSGLAGLLKGVLVIEKGYIPPQAHLAHLKPELQVDDLNVKVRILRRP
jgi:acyl transferase domain-containing protein